MSRYSLIVGLVLLMTALPLSGTSDGAPVTVSPGEGEHFSPTGSRCPTFSWGLASEAEIFELVVYQWSPDGNEVTSILEETLPGVISSWTPPLDRCLERGARYAWTVVARKDDAVQGAAELRFFEIVRASDIGLAEAADEDSGPWKHPTGESPAVAGAVTASSPMRVSAAAGDVALPPVVTADFWVDNSGNVYGKSFNNGFENLRMVRGVVSTAGEVTQGFGFTVARTGTGTNEVTFLTPFSGLPAVVASSWGTSGQASIASMEAGSAEIYTRTDSGTLVDGGFHFVAIGPR